MRRRSLHEGVRLGPRGFGLYPVTNRRVPHISLVFREMWDTTGLPSSLLKATRKLPSGLESPLYFKRFLA